MSHQIENHQTIAGTNALRAPAELSQDGVPQISIQNGLLTPTESPSDVKGLVFDENYKNELRTFQKAFNNKMRNKPVKHDHVCVLLLSWSPVVDDLQVKKEVRCFHGL